jgi:hypothetical protein
MKTFIRAAEIWTPTPDKSRLRFLDGFYGPLDQFREVSEQMTFGFDEGLPGKAWAKRHPVILKEFSNSYFMRTEAAKAAGLTCGTALPVFSGDELKAVLVLFCGDDEAHVGAIELWHNNSDESYEMKLVEGYYGTAEMFEFNSRHTHFPRGFGLPGRVWKKNMPLIMKDLLRSTAFLRWQDAVEVGINRGIGIPYTSAAADSWIFVLLSARDTPIARRFEIWIPNGETGALTFDSGDCDQNTSLAKDYRQTSIAKGEGTIGKVWRDEVPAINARLADDSSAPAKSAIAAGLGMSITLPVLDERGLKAVVAWYL